MIATNLCVVLDTAKCTACDLQRKVSPSLPHTYMSDLVLGFLS